MKAFLSALILAPFLAGCTRSPDPDKRVQWYPYATKTKDRGPSSDPAYPHPQGVQH